MKIEIKNLGAIKNATINLDKRLTVFCGPNNSGKTYMSFMIYALTKENLRYVRGKKDFINQLIKNKKAILNIDVGKIWEYRQRDLLEIKDALGGIYGISGDVVNKLFKDFSIEIKQEEQEFAKLVLEMDFQHEINIESNTVEIRKTKDTDKIELALKKGNVSRDDMASLEFFLNPKIYDLVSYYPFTSSYILPVERNSIYTFSKELSIQKQEFFERAKELGTNPSNENPFYWMSKRLTRYPLPIRDGLKIAEDLSNCSKTKTAYYDFAEEIEQDLLQGKIMVTKDGDVEFSSNRAKTKKIPIHLTASIVKTLSSLIFYLKHIAVKNDLIIIDEPELNLHPDNQVLIARIFARLINRGFRLLVSTHSDYIIREFNNLIMVSQLKDDAQKLDLGYKENEKIDKDSIGAYLFEYPKENSRNVTVNPIKITKTGFDVATMDKTTEALNEVSEDLFYSITEDA